MFDKELTFEEMLDSLGVTKEEVSLQAIRYLVNEAIDECHSKSEDYYDNLYEISELMNSLMIAEGLEVRGACGNTNFPYKRRVGHLKVVK